MTDWLANDVQKKVNRFLMRSVYIIMIAVVVFGAYAHLVHEAFQPLMLFCYIGALAFADGIYLCWYRGQSIVQSLSSIPLMGMGFTFFHRLLRSGKPPRLRGRDDQAQYQDYRTLSEGLRVLFYWRVAGIRESAAEHYLTRQKNELDWIRSGVRAWGLLTRTADDSKPAESTEEQRRLDDVEEYWLLDQLNYFIKSSYRERVKHIILRQACGGLLVASLAVSAFVLFFLSEESWEIIGFWQMWVAAGLVGLVILAHMISKWTEMTEESQEDEEELKTLDHIADKHDDIVRISKLHNDLRRALYAPVYWLLRGDKNRPRMLVLSWTAFFYGFAAGAAGAMVLGLVPLILKHGVEGEMVERYGLKLNPSEWLIVAMVLNVAVAALLQWYAEKRAFGSHYRQYKRMRSAFLLVHEAGKSATISKRKELLTCLGEEALTEHADWLLLHRDRPIELPKLEL